MSQSAAGSNRSGAAVADSNSNSNASFQNPNGSRSGILDRFSSFAVSHNTNQMSLGTLTNDNWSKDDTFSVRPHHTNSHVSSSTFAVTSVDVPDLGVDDDYSADDGNGNGNGNGAFRKEGLHKGVDSRHSRAGVPDHTGNTGKDTISEGSASTSSLLRPRTALESMDSNFDSSRSQPMIQDQQSLRQGQLRLAQRETRQLCWLRGTTIVLFFLASSVVGVGVFISFSQYQDDQFESVYGEQARLLLEDFEGNLEALLEGTEQWSFSYQSPPDFEDLEDFLADGASFVIPNPPFDQRAKGILGSTGASWLAVAPLVGGSNRTSWEDYVSEAAPSWLADPERVPPTIVPPPSAGDYAVPLWQHAAPSLSALVNRDLLSPSFSSLLSRELRSSVLATPDPTLLLGNITSEPVPGALPAPDSDLPPPLFSVLYFPMVVETDNGRESWTQGLVLAVLDWDNFLTVPTALGPSAEGIVCLLKTECDGGTTRTTYAYQVVQQAVGNETTTTASSHLVLERLDSVPSNLVMGMKESLDVLDAFSMIVTDSLQTTLAVQKDYCSFRLEVYPTDRVEDYYLTRHPRVYTGGIVGAFCFVSLVFLAYDILVERRQKKVMKSAAKTHEIVAGLFPENVRNRLFGDSMYASRRMSRRKRNKNQKGSDDAVSNSSSFDFSRDHHSSPLSPVGGSSGFDKDEFVSPRRPDVTGNSLSKSERESLHDRKGRLKSRPIADLFPHTTVLFADISGFTAWSSVRDPTQVFTLLETIYAAFDKVAAQRSVFKVETIGDCYVAVTGLPSPQEDHAIIMVKFARDCLKTMQRLTQQLEVELGPDTGDLSIRVGLHSGPVTAGVLRGQKSRFQLFGDTVNTASRMESNGLPNHIQCSQQTADLLIMAGKGTWIHPRKDMVHAKGKGYIQTYWVIASNTTSVESLNGSSRLERSFCSSDDQSDITEEPLDHMDDVPSTPKPASPTTGALKREKSNVAPGLRRLIEWNVDTLSKIIKTIVATRQRRNSHRALLRGPMAGIPTSPPFSDQNVPPAIQPTGDHMDGKSHPNLSTNTAASTTTTDSTHTHDSTQHNKEESADSPTKADSETSPRDSNPGQTRRKSRADGVPTLIVNNNPREEYVEAIQLPRYDARKKVKEQAETELGTEVTHQLQEYITTIACAYNDNPFHNFEHASHVTMSASKILKRVVNAEHVKCRRGSLDNLASKIHDYTYGITSDPLTHFACLFSALIHDVDHPGISNAQMLKEKHSLVDVYGGKSIAEQNSFDFAWELLMDSDFAALRKCLFENETELRRFRQLVINSIMATDVFDPDLVKLRNERWVKAFPNSEVNGVNNGGANSNGVQDLERKRSPGVPTRTMSRSEQLDLKATVVIEHIIQASDVAHTMQHWHVYQKWNRRLFAEMHAAYRAGRSPNDPAKSWYKGELWFYDNYIIPLAKKLNECRVFGASSHEFLTYAMDNRSEWEMKGEKIVQDMVASCKHQSEQAELDKLEELARKERRRTRSFIKRRSRERKRSAETS